MSAKELCLHVSASQGNYSGTLLITVTNGPNTFGRVNGVAILTRVFYKKVYGGFCQAAQKSSRNDELTVLPRWP